MSPLTGDAAGIWLGDEQRALTAWREHCAAREVGGVTRTDVRTA